MQTVLRESLFGQAVNAITKGKLFPHPEQKPDFVVPAKFTNTDGDRIQAGSTIASRQNSGSDSASTRTLTDNNVDAHQKTTGEKKNDTEQAATGTPIVIEEGKDPYLVDWYGDDDPENPQNWGRSRKVVTIAMMMLLTFSVYIGSAIYTPSIPGVMAEFGVSQTKAILGLSLYVLGYGLGPMIFSPLSEIPSVGRLNVYMATLGIFAILQIPTVLATNYNTLMAMRFFAGLVCSPALSTGGATIADIIAPMTQPYVMATWAIAAVCGPVLGPVAGGYAAQEENWRWPLGMLMGLAFICFFVLFFFFGETAHATILLRRAQRLRKLTGNDKLRSQSEIDSAEQSNLELISTALIRPFRLFFEPIVLAIDVYVALAYAIFYLWFEAFPIVFTGYGFGLGAQGLPFLGFLVAAIPTLIGYFAYQKYVVIPTAKRDGGLTPESRLGVALFGSFCIPLALFIFGWTAQAKTHWMGPVVGASLYLPGLYLVFQGAIMALAMSYGQYAASVLAGNALLRGVGAAVFPLFGHAFFNRLDIGPGSSLLAGLSIVMIVPIYGLFRYGHILRKRSKFAN